MYNGFTSFVHSITFIGFLRYPTLRAGTGAERGISSRGAES